MKTWTMASFAVRCGGCGDQIPARSVRLEIRFGARTLVRCQSCGERMYGEPAREIQDTTSVPVPQPSLPMELHQGPDYVTVGQLAKSVQWQGVQSRRGRR